MKALITAGGRGTRLRPITHTRNKHLIPIANKPMLQHAIEYVRDAGIEEAAIVINSDEKEVQATFGGGDRLGLRLSYIPQEAPLGLAHCIKISRDFIGDEPFVFYLGDNMLVGGIRNFRDEFESSRSNCHLTLAHVKDPERFGVPEIKNDRIVAIEEKPAKPKSSYAVAGIYFYDPSIFEAVDNIKPSARGELEISDAHQYLIANGFHVSYSEITGWWKDTGLPEDLLEANRLVLDHLRPHIAEDAEVDSASRLAGRVSIEDGAEVINSNIRGPVIIGRNTVIEDAYVGPFTSIQDHCSVRQSEIEYSIMLSNSSLTKVAVRVEGSLIGHDAAIIQGRDKPRTQRFIIGDQSIVQVV